MTSVQRKIPKQSAKAETKVINIIKIFYYMKIKKQRL